MKTKSLLIIAVSVLLFSCSPKLHVIPLKNSDTQIKKNGIIYNLPRTVFEIEFTVKHTSFVAGPYAGYAEKYLSIAGVSLADYETYEIEAINFNTLSQPDPDAAFMLCGDFTKHNMSLSLSKNGILQGINLVPEETGPNEAEPASTIGFSQQINDVVFTDYTVKRNFTDIKDTTYRVIKTDSVYQKIPVINTRITSKDIEQKAEEAANFIIKTRKQRFQLITAGDENTSDGAAMSIMVDELNKLEEKYLSLFIGKSTSRSETFKVYYVPRNDDQNTILFWISETRGVSFEKTEDANQVCVVVKNLGINDDASQFYKKQNELNPKRTGFYYRIPGKAEVKISMGDTILYNGIYNVAQMGILNWLDSKITGNKKIQISFDPALGSLRYIH